MARDKHVGIRRLLRLDGGSLWQWTGIGPLALVAALLLARQAWQAPLGPALVQPEAAILAVSEPVEAASAVATSAAVDDVAVDDVAPAESALGVLPEAAIGAPAVQRACGDQPLANLLVIGSDTRSDDYDTGRADFIRAVRVDHNAGSVRLLAVPRDLYVSIPLDPAHPLQDRVNTAYAYGNLYDVPGGGPSLLATTLHQNFGLSFDHYVVINFDAFIAAVDSIGGIDLDLAAPLDGTAQGLRAFPAGPQHLDGAALLDYVRIRYVDSDVHRGERQDQVIQAVRAKLLDARVIDDLPGLALSLSRLIQTDLSPKQIVSLVCVAQHLPPDALTALRIGWNQVTPHTTSGGAQVLLPREDKIAEVLAAFYGQPLIWTETK